MTAATVDRRGRERASWVSPRARLDAPTRSLERDGARLPGLRARLLPGGRAVTGQVPPGLALRLFEALFTGYDVLTVDSVIMAIPRDGNIPVHTPGNLSEIALKIADHQEAQR